MDTFASKYINKVKGKHGKKSSDESAGNDETNLLDFTEADSSSSSFVGLTCVCQGGLKSFKNYNRGMHITDANN